MNTSTFLHYTLFKIMDKIYATEESRDLLGTGSNSLPLSLALSLSHTHTRSCIA